MNGLHFSQNRKLRVHDTFNIDSIEMEFFLLVALLLAISLLHIFVVSLHLFSITEIRYINDIS